ncbi:hypothetical protein ACFCYN_23230 [Gottfriedia sp. NPDC056225]|uniref:hypothetical protein n=1 Tax=Gottfriedia sp. NPDC056225 TaxID=3345751 RepID=UPI0035DA1A6D
MISVYLLKPRQLGTDVYYKVFVSEEYLYFIKIGGQYFSRDAYFNQLSGFGILFWYWFKKIEKKQALYEAEIDLKFESGEIESVLHKSHNFKLLTESIEEIQTSKNKTFHTFFHDYGRISFKSKNGKINKFIIPDTNLRITVVNSLKNSLHSITIKEIK